MHAQVLNLISFVSLLEYSFSFCSVLGKFTLNSPDFLFRFSSAYNSFVLRLDFDRSKYVTSRSLNYQIRLDVTQNAYIID